MEEHDWQHDYAKSFAVFISGRGTHSRTSLGLRIIDDSFYIIFNAYHGYINYKLPSKNYAKDWTKILDTNKDKIIIQGDEGRKYQAEDIITVHGYSIVLLHHVMTKRELLL
jgi:glycogen operon protein